MTGDLYDLSDQLFQLRRDFLPHETGGVFLSAERVRQLTAGLMLFGQTALRYANEVQRRSTGADEDQVLAEALRPGTNLRLLSLRQGTIFADGAAATCGEPQPQE